MVSKNPTAKLLQNHMVKWLLPSIQIHGPMAKKTTPCSRCLEVFLGNLQRVPHNKPQSLSNHKIILRHAFDPLQKHQRKTGGTCNWGKSSASEKKKKKHISELVWLKTPFFGGWNDWNYCRTVKETAKMCRGFGQVAQHHKTLIPFIECLGKLYSR